MKIVIIMFFLVFSTNVMAGLHNVANQKLLRVGVEDSSSDVYADAIAAVLGENFGVVTLLNADMLPEECMMQNIAITNLDSGMGKAMMATALTAKSNNFSVDISMNSLPVELTPGYTVTVCVMYTLELL